MDWPDLVGSIFQISEEESVADAIRRIAALPPEQRQTTARNARDAALRLNNSSLVHWLNMLVTPPDDQRNNS